MTHSVGVFPRSLRERGAPGELSGAAVGAAAGLLLRRGGLGGADEGGEEFAFDLRGDLVDGDTGLGEERARVFDVVGARYLQFDASESGGTEFGAVVLFVECARNAAHPQQQIGRASCRERV